MAMEKKIDYVILGLLTHEPLTGYEIKKRIDQSLRLFWSASYGSIYPTLSQLEKDKKVIRLETKENGRDKIIYTITALGRESLTKWLRYPAEKDELRYETLLKLFFGDSAGSPQTIKHIKDFQEKIEAELPFLKAAVTQLESIKNTEPAHVYYLLTAKFGIKTYEAYLEWCKESIDLLSESQ